jgi:uncharacterized protein
MDISCEGGEGRTRRELRQSFAFGGFLFYGTCQLFLDAGYHQEAHLPPSPMLHVELNGVLGEALAASQQRHLATFIRDAASPAIALFSADRVCCNREGDWYGEHAGKWLVAASRAVARSGDAELGASVRQVADFLLSRQESDGYLGTYAPERRFMCRRGPAPYTWDGAPAVRTWDIWVHSYLILGLIEASRALSEPRYLQAAMRIGDLCWRTLCQDGIQITTLGNHHGLSATALIDPAMELHFATGEERYLDLARHVLAAMESSPVLNLIEQINAGTDLANIGTGKAYQLCWNLTGLAKLQRATGDARLAKAIRTAWENIRDHHLTLGGGPWGGVAHRSREVFNPRGSFSPTAYVETCSTLAWIQLNRELLAQTGEAAFAEEIEKAAYNDLLGAQSPEGDNWCYYSFPNGRRVFTTYWRCCKSSGPMGLEELPLAAYAAGETALSVHVYGPSSAEFVHPQGGRISLKQVTRYPFDGAVRLELGCEKTVRLTLRLRIPAWCETFTLRLNGQLNPTPVRIGGFVIIERSWSSSDVVELDFALPIRLHRRTNLNIQESRAPDGSPVAQEVLHLDYVAITRGPLVYSSGLLDGFKTEETIREPDVTKIRLTSNTPSGAPQLEVPLAGRSPLQLEPYFEAGGRRDRTWRITWFSLPPA